MSLLTPGRGIRKIVGAVSLAAVAALLLAGCSSDPLAAQYLSGDSKNYIAGDGTVTEIAPENRKAAVEYAGVSEHGDAISSADYAGQVVVLNYWYSTCAPCRAEAPDLAALSTKYEGRGASFLGVNVRDQADTARSFAETFKVPYPSIVDTDGALQLAFTGTVSPNAVPTTLVIDKEGRVSARILGRVSERSILDTLIHDAIAEPAAGTTSTSGSSSTPSSTPAAGS
jgi:peroxiredoxin